MIVCKECLKEFKSINALGRHNSRVHGINKKETYVTYKLDGINPLCKCGCGEETSFLTYDKGFADYKLGHSSRIYNNWGHNPNAQKKSHDTQRDMYSNGDLVIWNKGLDVSDPRVLDNVTKMLNNPDRGKKISKARTGNKQTEETKEKCRQAQIILWANPEKRKKQSEKIINRLLVNNHRNKKTKIESEFEEILISLSINYKYQHQISSAIFDFSLMDFNIIIEVDGDFHHCNPNSKYKNPVYPIQIKTVANDIRKNIILEERNIKLLRFWEYDIKHNKHIVINRLKEELGL